MGNTCDNCKQSFADEYELNKHARTCIVNTNYNEDKDDSDDKDTDDNNNNEDNNFNPLDLIFNETTSKILDKIAGLPNNNERRCILCCKMKPLSDYYKGKYRCKDCLKQKVKCPQCDILLTTIHLKRHITDVHNEKVKVQCMKCNKSYNRRYFISHICNEINIR